MARAGRLIYDGFFVMWDGFWMVWLSNLLWLTLCLPIVTIPLAFAGLYASAHGIAYGEPLDWKSFFAGAKKYFWSSLRWIVANLLVILTLAFYAWYFSGRILGSLSIVLLLFWWLINMYTFPFMLVQQKPSYLDALRNSAVLFLKWPGLALGFTLFNALAIALSMWLRFPWLIFGASLPALMACLCVKDVVAQTLPTDS